MIAERALDVNSPQYLDIPLVIDAPTGRVHISIWDGRKYTDIKETKKLADKVKAEPTAVGQFHTEDPQLVPKTRHDTAVANQQKTAPPGITLAPSLPVRDPLPRHDHHYGPAPPRDNRNQVSRRPSERQSHPVSYEINYPPHCKARHDEISDSDLPQIRVHRDVRPSRSTQPPAEQVFPPRGHGMRPAVQTLPPIPATSFYASLARPAASRPTRPVPHPHRIPPTGQQSIPQRPPVNKASEKIAKGLREEAQPCQKRSDIQLSRFTRYLLEGGEGLISPNIPSPKRAAQETPQSPTELRRSNVQLPDDDSYMETTPDAYHAALQFEEYENGVDDATHWQEGGTEDDVIEHEDLAETDVFGYRQAPDPY